MRLKQCLAIGSISVLAGCASVAMPSASTGSPGGTPVAVMPSADTGRTSPSPATSTGSAVSAPSLAPGEAYAFVFAGSRSISPGATVTEALTFESAPLALVALYGPSGSLSARVGSTPLVENDAGGGFSSWELSLNSPADADLTITNTSTIPVDVDATVSLATRRTLTVSSPVTAVAGVEVTVEVSLTEAASGEEPSAFLVDETGARTPIALTAAGPGRWSGTVAPPHEGSYRVAATVGGDRPRSGVDLLTASSGDVRLGGSFQEALAGNEDGIADGLRITIPFTTGTAGTFVINGTLRDSSGLHVAQGTGRTTLKVAGSGSIDVDFDGADIFRSRTSGRFRVTDVVLFQPDKGLTIEDRDDDMGLTAASYDAGAFESLP
jgi:hypothetical protein